MTMSFGDPYPPTSTPDRFASERVELPSSVEVPYTVQGSPDGVPVVMLHGLSDSSRSFELLFPRLPDTMRVFAPTLRGHGDAGRPASGYRPVDFAADVVEFMDAIEVDAAVIVGHSMGSRVAQQIAIDHPGRVLGLVLIGAFRSLHELVEIDELHAAIRSLEDPVDPEFVRGFQLSTITQPVRDDFVEVVIEESLKLPSAVWHATIAGFLDDVSGQHIDAITAPTLLIWGDHDSVVRRATQEAMVSTMPNARLISYHGTGHAVHWEQPERVASDLINFVNEIPATT